MPIKKTNGSDRFMTCLLIRSPPAVLAGAGWYTLGRSERQM
jgi:hypothetical protein